MAKHSRGEAEIAQAKEHSGAWIEAIPESATKRKANAARIAEVCQRLVSARPIQKPPHARNAAEGELLYPGFPAANYVQNQFRELVRFWRVAYERIIEVSAPAPLKRGGDLEIPQEALSRLDPGTRALVSLVQSYAKSPKRENDRLREIVSSQHPVPGRQVERARTLEGPSALDARHVAALRTWLSELREGHNGLEISEAGVRTTLRTRPTTLVVPGGALEAVHAACGQAVSRTPLSAEIGLTFLAEP